MPSLAARSAGLARFPGANVVTRLRYKGRNLRYRRLFEVLRQYAGGDVLDVGGGQFVRAAQRAGVPFERWTIIEPYEADLPLVEDPRVTAIVGDGTALQIEGNRYDTVLSMQVLEHVFEPIRMFEELYRVTKPGGHLIVMVPQTANIHHAPYHYQNLTRYWLDSAAERVGADTLEYHALGGAWSSTASRLLLQYPAALGVRGYAHPGVRRDWKFWALFPLGAVVSAVVFPLAMALSIGDLEEEANNHLVVLRKPQ